VGLIGIIQMTIVTRPNTKEYEEGYDRIFRKPKQQYEVIPLGFLITEEQFNKEEQSESNQERTSGRQGSSDAGTDTKAE